MIDVIFVFVLINFVEGILYGRLFWKFDRLGFCNVMASALASGFIVMVYPIVMISHPLTSRLLIYVSLSLLFSMYTGDTKESFIKILLMMLGMIFIEGTWFGMMTNFGLVEMSSLSNNYLLFMWILPCRPLEYMVAKKLETMNGVDFVKTWFGSTEKKTRKVKK